MREMRFVQVTNTARVSMGCCWQGCACRIGGAALLVPQSGRVFVLLALLSNHASFDVALILLFWSRTFAQEALSRGQLRKRASPRATPCRHRTYGTSSSAMPRCLAKAINVCLDVIRYRSYAAPLLNA